MRPFRALVKLSAAPKRRSPKWRKLEKEIIAAHPWCAMCGGTKNLQAHHSWPFHLFWWLELVRKYVVVLCECKGRDCHLIWGHLGNFKRYNPAILEQACSPGPGVPSPLWLKANDPSQAPQPESVAA